MTDRDPEFRTALLQATPRPQLDGDWEDVTRRAGRPRRKTVIAAHAALAVAVAVAGVFLVVLFTRLAGGGSPPAATNAPQISLLGQPQRAADLTSGIGLSPETTTWPARTGVDPHSIRFAQALTLDPPPQGAPSRFYVGTLADDPDGVCLIQSGPARRIACGRLSHLAETGAIQLRTQIDGVTFAVAGVVADGVTRARLVPAGEEVAVVSNTYAFHRNEGGPRTVEVLMDGAWRPVVTPPADSAAAPSIFDRPRTVDDRLFTTFNTVLDAHPELRPLAASSRVAFERSGRRYWIGGDGSIACLFASPDKYGCGAWEQVPFSGALVFRAVAHGGTFPSNDPWRSPLAGIAAPGYDTATVGSVSTPITNSVFAFPTQPEGTVLVLTGPAGDKQVDLARG